MKDDEMLPEYDWSKLRVVCGKHAEATRQGYSITVHHDDGSSTTRYVPPQASVNDDSMIEGKDKAS